MVVLTVGYVAGLIALAIFVAQLWVSTVLTYFLAGILRDRESAATWTVAGRALQSSYWPVLLHSDAARTHGVRRPVLYISMAIPTVAILVAVTGVVTPLGLYDSIEAAAEVDGKFVYAQDTSPFGMSTAPRTGKHAWSRSCRWGHGFISGLAPCPYTNNTVIISWNGTVYSFDWPNNYTSKVPPLLQEIYSSGTSGVPTTVSNYFDIEYRQLTMVSSRFIDDEQPMSSGLFRQVDSLILDGTIKPVEGLIVDAKMGGIGFRNHTIPVDVGTGATWTEDLLFVEPVTACVDTNLTFEFTITTNSSASYGGIKDLFLVDRGGFVNLNRTYPYYDRDDPQEDPDLVGRAYKAAFLNNAYSMMYLNVTNPNNSTYGNKSFSYMNSTLGKRFPMPLSTGVDYTTMGLSASYGHYLFGTGRTGDPKYPNPFNVTRSDEFNGARLVCSGAGNADIANISNIYVGCGLLRGAPHRTDGGPPTLFEDDSRWASSLHSCAGAARATIKTVTFSINNTDTVAAGSADNALQKLAILSVVDKLYPDGNQTFPLWGVEDSGLTMDGIQPIWGLISSAYENYPNISIRRAPSLYLLGYYGGTPFYTKSRPTGQNLPGSDFAMQAMNTVFADSYLDGVTGDDWPFDLIGRASMSIFTRWQNLSSSANTAGTIINLMWTDLAASAVVGTKGVLGPGNAERPGEIASVTVRPLVRIIKYNSAFGVPAFVLAVVMAIATLMAVCAAIVRKSSVAKLRLRMQQVSAGRILTTLLYPEYSTLTMPAKNWSKSSGEKNINLGMGMPDTADVVQGSAVELLHVRHTPSFASSEQTDKITAASPLSPASPPGYEPYDLVRVIPRKAVPDSGFSSVRL